MSKTKTKMNMNIEQINQEEEEMEYHLFIQAYKPIIYNMNGLEDKEDWSDDELKWADERSLMGECYTYENKEDLEEEFNDFVKQMQEEGFCTPKKIYACKIWCEPAWGDEQLNTDLEWILKKN